MPDRTYPELGNAAWTEPAFCLLQSLRRAAVAFAGPPEDPNYYLAFDSLMAALSRQRYGSAFVPTTTIPGSTETREQDAARLRDQDHRWRRLCAVLEDSEHDMSGDAPHPFDLARCGMSLLRPWPDTDAVGVEDLWWRMEVMSWYEEWPVMSVSPSLAAVARRETEISRQVLAETAKVLPGRRERALAVLRRSRSAYRAFREELRARREEEAEEEAAHRRICGSRICKRCNRYWWQKKGSPSPRY